MLILLGKCLRKQGNFYLDILLLLILFSMISVSMDIIFISIQNLFNVHNIKLLANIRSFFNQLNFSKNMEKNYLNIKFSFLKLMLISIIFLKVCGLEIQSILPAIDFDYLYIFLYLQ
jgi:hypothetical protein